jgi:Flp pilus assembly protein TadB
MADEFRTYAVEDDLDRCAWCGKLIGDESHKSKLNSKTYCSTDCMTAGEYRAVVALIIVIGGMVVVIVSVLLLYPVSLDVAPDILIAFGLAVFCLPFFCHSIIKGRKLRETIARADYLY